VDAEDLEPVPESSQFGAAQCRHACAHNFPAMVLYVGVQDFESQLLDSLETLCSDPEPAVRATMAAGMHQVISQLEGHGGWPGLLLGQLVSLLWDASLNVLQALVPNLEACLGALATSRGRCLCRGWCCTACGSEQQLVSLLDALEGCETALGAGPRWRLHASVLGALSALCYPSLPRQLHSRLGSMLLSRSRTAGALPCRLAASRSLLVCLRHSPCEADRRHLLQGILQGMSPVPGYACSGWWVAARARLTFLQSWALVEAVAAECSLCACAVKRCRSCPRRCSRTTSWKPCSSSLGTPWPTCVCWCAAVCPALRGCCGYPRTEPPLRASRLPSRDA
ncbi:unnamed protein product, partial [Ixodes persulcatus]